MIGWISAAREVWAGVDPDLSRLRLASRVVAGHPLTDALGRLATRMRGIDRWLAGRQESRALASVRPQLVEVRSHIVASAGEELTPELELALFGLLRIDSKLDEMAESLSR